MVKSDPRAVLERAVRERGEDYANLSRLIGRNAAYIQQFIKRGSPRKLDEADRAKIASYLGIDEQKLGAPHAAPPRPMIAIPKLAVGASAGGGAIVGTETADGHLAFDERWLRGLSASKPEILSIIRVSGDSMAPTLSDGDDIMVDRGDASERLRDGIYVLRREDSLSVKRLALNPTDGRVAIRSDNSAYPDYDGIELASLTIIGRVVWAGRRLG